MYNHAPEGYRCPFCRNLRSGDSDLPLEIVHRYDDVFVKMNPKWWPSNPGAVLVIPNDHYENVYDIPPALGTPIQVAVRDAALAMKIAYACDGVSTRSASGTAASAEATAAASFPPKSRWYPHDGRSSVALD